MRSGPQLVSAPLNLIPIEEHLGWATHNGLTPEIG